MSDKIGFGSPSARSTTRNSNWFARFSTTPRAGGCDVRIDALRGHVFENGESTITLHLRKDHGPAVGRRVMVDGRVVKVAERRYDESGRLMLLDEDTRGWFAWK